MSGATFRTLDLLDKKLALAGQARVFAQGTWWRAEVKAFYEHGGAEWWAQVGRGGAKSTVIYRVALNESLYGTWTIPPGETHFAMIKSRNKEEAGKAIGILSEYLTALGVDHAPAGDVIELTGTRRAIRVVASNVGATSGWRSFFDACDEVAKWPSEGSASIDAAEVISSGDAMCVTHVAEGAKRLRFSAPFYMTGPHYETCVEGTTSAVYVSAAASWVANPIITEAITRKLEKNPKTWQREYAAIPAPLHGNVFDVSDIDHAFVVRDWRSAGTQWTVPILVVDPASGGESRRVDSYTWGLCRWGYTPGRGPLLAFSDVGGVTGAELRNTTVANVVARFCAIAKAGGARLIIGDQRDSALLAMEVPRHGLQYQSIPWSAQNKPPAVELLRQWLRENSIWLPDHKLLKRELLSFEETYSAQSGQLTFQARGSSHDDYVSLLVTAAMAHDRWLIPRAGENQSARYAEIIADLRKQVAQDASERGVIGPCGWGVGE